MKKYIFIILGLIGFSNLGFADCIFSIINYTSFSITAKVGFYGKSSKTIVVKPLTTASEKIASDYKCNDSTLYGTGVSYILFTKDPNSSGANYSPLNGVNLMGRLNGTSSGRIVQSDNGNPIWLNATGLAIDEKEFQINLNFIKQSNSTSAGTK